MNNHYTQLIDMRDIFKIPPSSFNIDFSSICKDLREELGLTQEEMAKYLGVSARTYYYWEAGDRQPNGRIAVWLAQTHQELTARSKTLKPDDRIEELSKQIADLKTILYRLTEGQKKLSKK
ncbi:MAG: helix-turn-helix transcriptional regulator [Acidobacteriota bacterium]